MTPPEDEPDGVVLVAPDALLDVVKEDAPTLLLAIADVAVLLLVALELPGALLLVMLLLVLLLLGLMMEVAPALLAAADVLLPGKEAEEPCVEDEVPPLDDAPLLLASGHSQRPKVPAGEHTW